MPIRIDAHAEILPRFLRYVQIDTQSDESAAGHPTTEKQWALLRLLAEELREVGAHDVVLAGAGYVTATIPGTLSPSGPAFQRVPVLGFLAHVDTSPAVTGAGVRPQVVRGYAGGDIVLPGDASQVIRASEYPELGHCIGHDIITTDGTTLLGADDKAGVAEIMAVTAYFIRHPEIPHGPIRVAFTTDEEVGRGTEGFDVAGFGAEYAYTVDGSGTGEIEDETFNAAAVKITIKGHSVHPGYAKGKLVNSVKLAAELLVQLPPDRLSPETTEGREGYVHPDSIVGSVEETQLKFILRDFTREGLAAHERLLRELVADLCARHPAAQVELAIDQCYRNMKEVLDRHPSVVANAEEAIRRAGLQPVCRPIRGGTDGAHLSAAGLPTANLFTGGHAYHSRLEWISLQDMAEAVETIVELVQVWAERA